MASQSQQSFDPAHDFWLRPLIGAITVLGLLSVVSTSCIDHQRGISDRADVTPVRRTAGRSVQGRPIEYVTFGRGKDVVLILATIHGDEDAGTPLLHELERRLETRGDLIKGKRVVLMAVANPDGYAAQSRLNVRGVDLNRNFPAGNFDDKGNHGERPLSEPESVALHALIDRERPARIISIHQPLNYGSACIDYDGPGEPLAGAMARFCELPVNRIGSRPGSLGSYAGETLGTPIITLELPKEAKGQSGQKLWQDYGQMLLAAITYPHSP
ncbi:MAG TPA: M14 family zinc carboxypeptidase [Phycisphaerae bacterium]|nr:M14 family zinc carboxypeptidase [Phycisphaerae bacterium]